MIASRRQPSKVFFPWERRRGLFGVLGRARVRLVVLTICALAVVLWIRSREERAASIRATRASITLAYRAVTSYRADHNGACPKDLGELVSEGYVQDIPVDAWGRALRLTCPGRRDPASFEISSDGPDGLPGGLDRVE
ncbi:MAG: type II secretion system protein GspG [Polyangiaceae bacterium]|nr:type II secretion system protein GspG [Polyangiaceae bacterium]